jgi:hypothetical protein
VDVTCGDRATLAAWVDETLQAPCTGKIGEFLLNVQRDDIAEHAIEARLYADRQTR